MKNLKEDLAKVRSLQASSCLTNYYRKCIEDMEKELHLDGLELDALENEMRQNGSSFEIEKVKRFFDEYLNQPEENLPDHYQIWWGIQEKIQDAKERSKTESPKKDQKVENSSKTDSTKRKKSPKKKSGIKTRSSSLKPGTSKKQNFEDISSVESRDLSRDKNEPNSLVPSRSASVTSSVTPRRFPFSSDLPNDLPDEELPWKKKKNDGDEHFTSKTIKPHKNTTITPATPTFRLLTSSSKRIADTLDLLSDKQRVSFLAVENGFEITGGSTYRLGTALKSIKKLDWGSQGEASTTFML